MIWRAVILWLAMAMPGWAGAPETSLRPEARVGQTVELVRPKVRPPSPQVVSTASRVAPVMLDTSLRPALRPESLIQRVLSRNRKLRQGMICGTTEIQGEVVGLVPGRINGCGVKDAVRVRSVSGVALSQQAVIDCPTAKALNRWVNNGAKPALRSKGRLVELRVAAHYACRTRNNQPGARISEHGKGKAIDISGFRMDDGEVITVLKHWNARGYRDAMRKMWRTACGPFGTVLGPQSDRFHRDHFHFDTAQYRSGPFCR